MNPMSRWRLQFTVSEAGKSAADLLKLRTEFDPDQPDVIDLKTSEGIPGPRANFRINSMPAPG